MKLFRRATTDPLWRDEFSVHATDERYVTRRQLTKFLVLTSLGMFVGNVWILVKSAFTRELKYPAQPIARVDEIAVGDVKLFAYPEPNDHCILVRTVDGQFYAYSQKCTHLSCAVYYSKQENRLLCPCHEGVFSVKDGRPIAGPPTRPLPRVVLEERNGTLIATGLHSDTREA